MSRYGTTSSTLPTCPLSSSTRWASAASRIGIVAVDDRADVPAVDQRPDVLAYGRDDRRLLAERAGAQRGRA